MELPVDWPSFSLWPVMDLLIGRKKKLRTTVRLEK